jgi:hypothetical protein
MGKLNMGIPQVPTPVDMSKVDGGVAQTRVDLPIWRFRQEILQSIAANQVTVSRKETFHFLQNLLGMTYLQIVLATVN